MSSGTWSENVAVLILGLSIPNYSSLFLGESWVPGQDPGKYGCLVTSRLTPSSSLNQVERQANDDLSHSAIES